jgi:hypothetical protein
MKLAAAFALLPDLFLALKAAFLPTCRVVLRSPILLFYPATISRLLMANVWTIFGSLVDEGSRTVKQDLITQNAYGVVLDIGAG